MRIWTIANQKGGVGKTTTAVALGGLLAEQGQRVLLLDLDPHGSMTSYFKYEPEHLGKSSFDIFAEHALTLAQARELHYPTSIDGMVLIPSSMALATIERRAGLEGMGLKVSRMLALLWDDFDYVLIDTPPVLGALMINSLAACERLLIPVQTEFLALKGLERMLRTITMVTRSLQKNLDYLILPTMFDRRTHASIGALRSLRIDYADAIWPSMIPVDTRFRDASKKGVTPSQFDAEARGVAAYRALLKFLLSDSRQRVRAS